jgi:hypothetical protein
MLIKILFEKNKKKRKEMKGLSSSLWFELFFKYRLSIESGVSLARTCSFFWNNERIQNWIREKEKQVFGSNISKSAWNKLAYYVGLPTSSIKFLCKNHIALYARTTINYASSHSIYYKNETYIFGVFSSKERLFLALKTALYFYFDEKHYNMCYDVRNGFFIVTAHVHVTRRDELYVSDVVLKDFENSPNLRKSNKNNNGRGL